MTIIAALDESGGMMFNGRRQSQDKTLRERILDLSRGGILRMNAYTYKQFGNLTPPPEHIRVEEQFLDAAGESDFCFVENVSVNACADRVGRLILFHWNRSYPGDFRFDLDYTMPPWKRVESVDFPGASHEKITQEVYIREE